MATTMLLGSTLCDPIGAAVTLVEGKNGKLDAEVRLMFWGVSEGRDSVPAGATPQDEHVNDFLLRRGRIILRAQASEKLQLYCQVGQDYVGSKVATEETSFRVKDLYLNYRFTEGFQATAGQFKIPFLRQNLESGFNQLLVDRAVLPGQRPAKEGSRDLGVMAWGNEGGFQYQVAVFDGSDQEAKSSNSSLRAATRLSYNWFTRETTPGYTGTWIGEKRVLQVAGQVDAQDGRLDPKDDAAFVSEPRDYRAWALDIFYDQPFHVDWAFTLEGGGLHRRDNYDEAGLDSRTIKGYYGQTGLLLPWHLGTGRLQVATRYESLHMDRGPSSRSSVSRSVGASYFGKGHDRKVQVDYTRRTESPVELDNDEVRLSVIAVF
jgi:hypothetical protein